MEQPPFAEFAAYLATLKRERDLTQSDIARALNVAPSQPSGWMSGRSRPKPENLERMAEVYGIDVNRLLALCRYRRRPDTGEIDPDEIELLAIYRQVPTDQRHTVKSMLRGLTGRRRPPVTEPDDELGRSNLQQTTHRRRGPMYPDTPPTPAQLHALQLGLRPRFRSGAFVTPDAVTH